MLNMKIFKATAWAVDAVDLFTAVSYGRKLFVTWTLGDNLIYKVELVGSPASRNSTQQHLYQE